jgi:hypothetical protein
VDDRHVMRLIKAAEKIATSLDHISATLDKMHASDPIQAINAALAAEIKETPQDSPNTTVAYGADVPESERWRLGNG